MLKLAVGEMTDYGLPKPDHKLLETHPTVSSELLPRLGHGDIEVKPNIDRFTGGSDRPLHRRQRGGDRPRRLLHGLPDQLPLPRPRRVRGARQPHDTLPARRLGRQPGLYFIGFIQPLGPIMPVAEAQSEWVADLLEGRAALPSAAEMRREIEDHERRMEKRFVASKRHTIEVDFHPYLREIRRERKRVAPAGLSTLGDPPVGPGRSRCRPAPPPCGPRRGPRGPWGCGRSGPEPAVGALLASLGLGGARLAHQTSHRAPKTGIFRTTSRKKIGTNPSTGQSTQSRRR